MNENDILKVEDWKKVKVPKEIKVIQVSRSISTHL